MHTKKLTRGFPEKEYTANELLTLLGQAPRGFFSCREEQVLRCRMEGKTFKGIGLLLGLSAERIRTIFKEALFKWTFFHKKLIQKSNHGTPIYDLRLHIPCSLRSRIFNILNSRGIYLIEEIIEIDPRQLFFRNFGMKSLRALQGAISQSGISLPDCWMEENLPESKAGDTVN